MAKSTIRNQQQLFKILVAAAWIDGEFQPEEKEYLQKVAEDKTLLEDTEIQSLLSTDTPISSEQCYQWLNEYLGNKPTEEVYQNLLAEIAGLVYVDGDIAEEEANLLTQLQTFDPNERNIANLFKPLLGAIRQLYRKQVDKI